MHRQVFVTTGTLLSDKTQKSISNHATSRPQDGINEQVELISLIFCEYFLHICSNCKVILNRVL